MTNRDNHIQLQWPDTRSREQQYWEQRGGEGPHPWSPTGLKMSELDKVTEQEWNESARKASQRQVGGDHYNTMKIEPIEFVLANNLGYCEGNAIKYICRHAVKGGVQDVDKAIHYLQLLKEYKYGQ